MRSRLYEEILRGTLMIATEGALAGQVQGEGRGLACFDFHPAQHGEEIGIGYTEIVAHEGRLALQTPTDMADTLDKVKPPSLSTMWGDSEQAPGL